MQPIAQISIPGCAGAIKAITSGAKYRKEPAVVYSMLIFVYEPQIPKSTIFIKLSFYLANIIFSNFKSL